MSWLLRWICPKLAVQRPEWSPLISFYYLIANAKHIQHKMDAALLFITSNKCLLAEAYFHVFSISFWESIEAVTQTCSKDTFFWKSSLNSQGNTYVEIYFSKIKKNTLAKDVFQSITQNFSGEVFLKNSRYSLKTPVSESLSIGFLTSMNRYFWVLSWDKIVKAELQYEVAYKIKISARRIFRTQSKIYDGAFVQK